jgi:ABC-type bacteriocin/lantibiotic exporter with double-glycine peptidase domain
MGDYRPFSDEELDRRIAGETNQSYRAEAIAERERRHSLKVFQQSIKEHQELIAEQQRLKGSVDALVSSQSVLKDSVDRIHCVDIAILIVGSIAAISGVILLFLKH